MFHEDPQHRFKRALVETPPPPKRDQTSTHDNTFFFVQCPLTRDTVSVFCTLRERDDGAACLFLICKQVK